MTITERTADLRRRLDEIAATQPRGAWCRRRPRLVAQALAVAADLAADRDRIEAYITAGLAWCWANWDAPSFAEKDARVAEAIAAHARACDALDDALAALLPIDPSAPVPTFSSGVFDVIGEAA